MSRPAQWAPLRGGSGTEAVEARLKPFRDQGVLDSLDVHVVDQLGVLMGERDPDVLLALALVVRAPRFGHICVDVENLRVEELFSERLDRASDEAAALGLPEDRKTWRARIESSPLVGTGEPGQETRPFVLSKGLLYADRYFTYQGRLTRHLQNRVSQQLTPRDAGLLQKGLGVLFASTDEAAGVDRQKLGAAMAVLRGLTVISGGPGTGKTYTVRSVLTLLWADWSLEHDPRQDSPGPRAALAAPTGKAAARMKESILEGLDEFIDRAGEALPPGKAKAQLRDFLTSLQPSTIHRLLRWNPENPTRFRHDAKNPLSHAVVVVDEASMVDFALMTKLVDAVAPDARLILLGDQHQLASVEAGTVLADLCGPTSMQRLFVSKAFSHELANVAGITGVAEVAELRDSSGPHDAIVQLDKSRRFKPESGIGQFARACLMDDFDPEPAVDILTSTDRYADVTLLEHGERGTLREETKQAIVAGYLPYVRRLLRGPGEGEDLACLHQDVLDRFDQFRVLCAHRQSRLGVAGMNPIIIALLERALRKERLIDDRALHSQREYWVGRPILVTNNDYVVRLFNGDVGIVVEDENGERKVAFADPDGVRYVTPSRLPEHQTVFAMTIHKSQGSEFDHAMVILPERDSPILTRELVYTAVTRAKHRMTMVGEARVLHAALNRTVRRASGLQAELWGRAGGMRVSRRTSAL